mmetsp:Transcript_37893/g.81812  ORF Transcript_37893/g.81812 Transcript_37893/m.81812 type:complete len:253 (-) Transcript_37893:203-961(-)
MTARPTTLCILVLAILLSTASAFTSRAGSTCFDTVSNTLLPRLSSSPNNNPCKHHPFRLYAATPQADDEPPENEGNVDTSAAATSPSKYEDGDPRQALEQFGSLFTLVQAIFSEGSTWDSDTLEEKTREFVSTYLRVFVPGVGYAVTSFAVFGSSVLSFLLALAVSGRGYSDILAAVGGIEPLRNLLEKADPAWGNVAIALVGCEVISPVILAVTLALTPKTMDALRVKLDELGWGEDDIDERVADILQLTG